jgi:signal transduction histidine kinase
MPRLRLRTQLLVATLFIISLLAGAILLIVRHAVRLEVARQVQDSTQASLRAFENFQQQRETELSRTAALLAELPPLKALMTTEHAATIQDASQPFWKLAGSDLFLLASPEGKVLGFKVANPSFKAVTAESYLSKSLEEGTDSAWWYADGQLYWVFLRPIMAGSDADSRRLGILAVGYQVNKDVAQQLALVSGGQIALTADDSIIASTLSPSQETELQRWVKATPGRPTTALQQQSFGATPYEVARVMIYRGSPASIYCYVLLSLEQAEAFIARLNWIIFLLGGSAVVLAGILLSFVSWRITRPLDNLVAGVRALAAGDYGFSITPRGSSEVAELAEAFAKMRRDLLSSQEKMLASERIAALGRAASSISHDLRHYLAAVVANAEFLYEAEKLKVNRDDIYDEIKTASNEMLDLLDSLRELAREGPAIYPVPAHLDQSARRVVDAVLAIPELRGRAVTVHTSGEMDGVFDPKKIERALFNLLLNACEATQQGSGEIRIDASSFTDSFEIRVADNGAGVPSQIRATLFDPFVSAAKPNGTGLGLAIVTKIVQDHGGAVSVEKTSEVGTVFLLKFPRFSQVSTPAAPLAVT